MIEEYNKQDPPTKKMLLVKADVPEVLVEMGYSKSGLPHAQAIGDLSLIAFYYLLCIGKYIVKAKHNNKNRLCNSNSRMYYSSKRIRRGPWYASQERPRQA
jgi:hypothetical protein